MFDNSMQDGDLKSAPDASSVSIFPGELKPCSYADNRDQFVLPVIIFSPSVFVGDLYQERYGQE